MRLCEKLQILRKQNGLSQEELAEKLGISRQAVSKWESGQSIPDLNKLIIISELYNITIDNLVKERDEFDFIQKIEDKDIEKVDNQRQIILNFNGGSLEYEYKSKRLLFGVPLVHINLGRGFKKARGILAIGNISYGVISIGGISFGILSIGGLSIGLVSLAALSIGLLLAVGAIAIGIFSIGAIAIGIFSGGAIAIGKYAAGAGAIASDIAVGDYANANISIGNRVEGMNTLSLYDSSEEVKRLIKSEYPNLGEWIINIINFIIRNCKFGN